MNPSDFANALGDWADGSGPLYRELAQALRRAIEDGTLRRGARLPAERTFAQVLRVSRTTVVGAYEILREEGWVESRRGSGTRVRRSTFRPSERDGLAASAFERNTLLRGLVESRGSTIEFLGVHLPAAAPFLEEALAEAPNDVAPLLAHHGYTGLGLPSLRQAIADHLARTGLPSTLEQILVTHGAQQAIGLTALLLLQPGDAVLLEDPTYVGAIDVFTSSGARFVPVPMGPEGVRLDLFREAISREAPRLIYLMPTFQNPTGAVMSERNRREIARLAEERGIPVLEDNTLADLDLGSAPPPPLGAFAPAAPILSIGSLSKLIWGGLRIGWIRASEPIITRLTRWKIMGDLGNSVISQAVAARLLDRSGAIRDARRKQIGERLDVLADALARLLPEWTWKRPEGGLSLWARLPRGNALEFAEIALRHGVSVLPGPTCSPQNGFAEFLRLPFVLDPDGIREGIRRLADAWRAYRPAAARRERASLDVLV